MVWKALEWQDSQDPYQDWPRDTSYPFSQLEDSQDPYQDWPRDTPYPFSQLERCKVSKNEVYI